MRMVEFTRRSLMKSSAAAVVGAGVTGVVSAQSGKDRDGRAIDNNDGLTEGAPSVVGDMKRFSTTAFGAEMTGPFVFEDGSLLHSVQHPDRRNPEPFGEAGIGYYRNFAFEFDGNNDDFAKPSTPQGEEQDVVRAADHEFEVIAQAHDPIGRGSEELGVTETPDGTKLTTENFAGTMYGDAAYNPDCNQFVATNDAGTEGYLFTNWENSPGNVTRIPLSQNDAGEWEADLENALNLANTEPLRELGGTRINCYGDLSPWGTMLSSEENYAHPRVSLGNTVSDIVEAGTGEGLIGGCQFWNRPNPTEVAGALDEYYEDSWSPQGVWALSGVEFLAYYLGAEPVTAGDDGNPAEPIGDVYPNPYRYGYHVDFREPAADPPQPVKYYVMGRAAWEAPDVLPDEKTVYGCSDGDSKGIYKFVADEPIPSYDDPMDVEGTLYAPKITNDAASSGQSPAEVPLEVEWLPLGHASNTEIESWIAEYDDVTQVDYLEAHAETDWQADLETALAEADQAVVENGNQNYVTNEEIVEWAAQYEARGPDGVDEHLRRVPFIETRAAAKEIGASIEFNKAEGIDSMDDAEPGDFIYVGISEFNDDLDDQGVTDGGDVALDRVDGGVVYRAELEADYDISRLEPVIVGPDFTEEEAMADADDALRNVDNVYTMRDGRVLCCEDGWRGANRSYPNDGLFVYQPPVSVDVESVAVSAGTSGEIAVYASAVPAGVSGGNLSISVEHTDVATITGASLPDGIAMAEGPTISDDGSTVEFRFADLDDAISPGQMDAVLASLEITAQSGGTTDLTVEVESLDDDSGSAIDVQERAGVVIAGPPAIDGGRPPTDPDGDGQFEDLNGNGYLDYDDVRLLFEHLEDDAVTAHVDAYDFNENDQLDFDDVVALYEER